MVDHAARLKSATHLLLQLAEEFAQRYATKRKFKVYISWHPSYRHKTADSKVKITNMCGHSSMDLVTKQWEDVYDEAHMSLIGDGALRSVTNEVARLKSGPCYLPAQLLCSSTLCSTLVHCVQHWSPTPCLTQNIFLLSVHKYSTAAVFYVICQNLLCIYPPHLIIQLYPLPLPVL